MTDAEIMALYEQGASLDHIAAQVTAREINGVNPKKKMQNLERVRQVVYRTLVERRKRHAAQEP